MNHPSQKCAEASYPEKSISDLTVLEFITYFITELSHYLEIVINFQTAYFSSNLKNRFPTWKSSFRFLVYDSSDVFGHKTDHFQFLLISLRDDTVFQHVYGISEMKNRIA